MKQIDLCPSLKRLLSGLLCLALALGLLCGCSMEGTEETPENMIDLPQIVRTAQKAPM